MLKHKSVIITGSNRGIGKTILEQFAKNGANIWAHTRTQSEEFENEIAKIAYENNIWIKPIYFDLSKEKTIKEAFKQIYSAKQAIDILVNNAGMPFGSILSMTPMSKLKEVFEVNYFSQIYLMQLVSKMMMKQKSGNIINIASVGGIETNEGYLAYGSSKAALIWATKSISKELAPYNIRVNAVAPGLVKTQMGMYKNEIELAKTIQKTSMKRMAEPLEIANAVLFLATNSSSFITGHILSVDGGR